MERRYRESEKKIHKSPFVDPGELSVDLPQDIIRQGGDLILLKKPISWNYPEGYFNDLARAALASGAYGGGGGGGSGSGGRHGINSSDYGSVGTGGSGSKYGYGSSPGSRFHSGGGGSVGGGGGFAGGNYASGGLGSPYSRGVLSEGYHSGSGVNSGHSNNDYAAPSARSRGGGYPVSIKRSASHGDSSSGSGFTPAMADGYSSSRIVSLSSPHKHAGLNPFPVSPADARLSSWASRHSPGGSSLIATPGGSTSTTTEYKRLYQSSVSTRTTANGSVTFNEYQDQKQQEQGKYYS